jgi:hypothetical protein
MRDSIRVFINDKEKLPLGFHKVKKMRYKNTHPEKCGNKETWEKEDYYIYVSSDIKTVPPTFEFFLNHSTKIINCPFCGQDLIHDVEFDKPYYTIEFDEDKIHEQMSDHVEDCDICKSNLIKYMSTPTGIVIREIRGEL